MKEIYFSIDVETNGPIPGRNSMLSLGCAAFTEANGINPVSTYEVNLETLDETHLVEIATEDDSTMEWWKTQPEAWEYCRQNLKDPYYAMVEFANWVEAIASLHKAKPVCIAYPAGFDFMFVYWYLIEFTEKSPFSFSCIDIKTLAFSLLKTSFRESSKKNWKNEWLSNLPHTHKAIDDAIEQGQSFMKMLKELRN